MKSGFKKITPVNGFDSTSSDNAKQNCYVWSMEELGDYLYAGTGRNLVWQALTSGSIGYITPPEEFIPKNIDMCAEIWRSRKDGKDEWERVYKASPETEITGFRSMINYTTPDGETALYASAYSSAQKLLFLKTLDGTNWTLLDSRLDCGHSARSMTVYNQKLYMAVVSSNLYENRTLLYESTDPEKEGWRLIDTNGTEGKNPRGEITAMKAFNNHLYVCCALAGGFEVWKSAKSEPEKDHWVLVVDKGAGDALNEVPLSVNTFKNCLYIGAGAMLAILSLDKEKKYIPPKGFDLIRVNENDEWQVIIGGEPKAPTEPTTGIRTKSLSGFPSGFGCLTNAYCWQIQEHNGEMYIGSWDYSVMIPPLYRTVVNGNKELLQSFDNEIIKFVFNSPELVNVISKIFQITFGFDLWKSIDGLHWTPLSINGLNNPHNYGVRSLLSSSDGNLYIGTANPFEGCEVWSTKKNYSYNSSLKESIESFIKYMAASQFPKAK